MMTTSNTNVINRLRNIVPEEQLFLDEPMSKHTSFKIGGKADAFVIADNEKELSEILKLFAEENTRYMLIGNGSDLLFDDEGYRGVILKLGEHLAGISCNGDTLTVGTARLLSSTANFAKDHGLAGLEFASGIPGSVGGAIFMNAGAYGGEMKDVVTSVSIMKYDGSEIYELSGEELAFGYRHSFLQGSKDIALYVKMKLKTEDKAAITERMKDLSLKRTSKQPLNYPSAGSIFKRPAGGFAAALIEEAGLKGRIVGGAQVSEKHSGFVINTGDATAEDVKALIKIIQEEVFAMTEIKLEPEVRIIDAEK